MSHHKSVPWGKWWWRNRIWRWTLSETVLQNYGKKGVSEYQLSYDLGHSKNYIHNIVTGYSQPSVKELLYLIDTLGITPRLFFDEEAEYRNPILVQEIIDGIKSMNDQDLEAVLLMVRRLNEKN